MARISFRLYVVSLFSIFLISPQMALSARAGRKLTAAPPSPARTFMASLPLNISLISPPELASGQTALMSMVQDITVVFSRPVIALGSDFENDGAVKRVVPFRLSCNWPGNLRWVTTSIARFDPDKAWPSDLRCDVIWNTALKTWDGAALQLGSVPSRSRLISSGLQMSYYQIISEMANNLTAGNWDYNGWLPDDKAPEVPPDGRIQIYFSYEVNLQAVASALQLLEGRDENILTPSRPLNLTVRPCTSPVPWMGTTTPGSSLNVTSTCMDVEVGRSLQPDTWYTLRLPAGTRYNAVSGNLTQNIDLAFAGLIPFRIPFSEPVSEETPITYTTSLRRWDMDLPHGLAQGTTAADLASSFVVCELATNLTSTAPCTPVAFNLTLVQPAMARLTVPGAQPLRVYRIYVSNNPAVRDGFGLPLQASSSQVPMYAVGYALAPPSLLSTSLAVLEPEDVDPLASWPYITRAPPPTAYGWPSKGYPINISSYRIDVNNQSDVIGLLSLSRQYYNAGRSPGATFGTPNVITAINENLTIPGTGVGWTQVNHPLSSSPIQFLDACCIPWSQWYTESKSQVVLRTGLSLTVVESGRYKVAWVTDAVQGGGSGPIAGADVTFYVLPNSWSEPPRAEANCTTNTQGFCTVLLMPNTNGGQLVAVARVVSESSGLRTAILPNSGYVGGMESLDEYLTSVILDRTVVEPGDSLKVTGFIQHVTLEGLSPPLSSYVLISGSDENLNFQTVIKVDNVTGSFHAEVEVPENVQMGDYFLVISITSSATAPRANDTRSMTHLTSVAFTVSSPRKPTAELQLVADSWVTPNGTLRFNATAISYIGASVGNSTITVRWLVSSLDGAQDVLTLTTNADGFAAGAIDLAPAAAAASAQGRTLSGVVSVNVEWIGPTRERITKAASVPISSGPLQLATSTSISTDLPFVPFSVAAIITSTADGSGLNDIPVNITLAPKNGATCNTTLTCSVLSGKDWSETSACRVSLPCVGVFTLLACANVPYNNGTTRVCSSRDLGLNTSQWSARPLSFRAEPALMLDKADGYRLGESPRLSFENPYSGARLLVVWGTEFGIRTKVFTGLPGGALFNQTIDPLGPECKYGCSLTAVLDVPRASPADLPLLPPRSELPVSALFDPRSPHTHTLYTHIHILPDNMLPVSLTVTPLPGAAGNGLSTVQDSSGSSLPVVEPGRTAQVTVNVGSTPMDGPVEVTVYAIDKAFLDLKLNELTKPELEIIKELYSQIGTYQLDPYRVTPGAIRAVYDKLMARLTGLDPWLPVDTTSVLMGRFARPAVDIPDAEYLASLTTSITGMNFEYMAGGISNSEDGMMSRFPPSRGRGGVSTTAPGATSPVTNGGIVDGGGDAVSSDLLRQSGDFIVTPLFAYALTNATGHAVFNFTAPPNLGTFVIRAFAAAGSKAKYGSAESKVVVRRRLSLTPSVPAFVRVGDSFEAGVVVTVGSAPANITVSLQSIVSPTNSLRAVGAQSSQVVFLAGGDLQREVRFNFSARAMGATRLIFAATDGVADGGRDLLQMEINVEGQQGDVWLATSFAIASNSSITNSSLWGEGLELPAAVPGSGGLTLTAGVGYLPALLGVYDNLLVTEEWRTDPFAQPAVLWTTLPAVLSYYSQFTTSAQAAEVTQAVQDLTALTSSSYGLRWMLPTSWSGWSQNRVDISLNNWATFIINFHFKASYNPTTGPLADIVRTLMPTWMRAVDTQIVADVEEAWAYKYTYNNWNTLAWIRFARGALWAPQIDNVSSRTLKALSLNRTLMSYRSNQTAREFDRETRILLSLALLSMGPSNPDPRLVNEVLTELTASFRVQGRTAYLAWAPGYPTAASLEEQALGLLLFVRTGTRNALVPKLAAYVANSLSSSGGSGLYYYYSPWTLQALVVAALSEYDSSRGSSQPTLNLNAIVEGLNVLQATFRVNRTNPVTNTTAWEVMPPSPVRGRPRELDFQVAGTGEVTVAASMQFVPAVLPSFPAFRGISVDLAIQMVNPLSGAAMGPRVSAVPLGSVVLLTVQLSTPDDLGAVTVSIMMPGGLEPLDPNLVADAGSSCILDYVSSVSYFYPRWWWWPICPARETRPSVVTFKYAALRAGTSVVTIKAVAATAGTFVVPPIRASVDDQPEVMGMTAGGSFRICTDCVAAMPAPAPRAPRPCPEDCSQNGICNLRTGQCICDLEYTGADCSTLVVAPVP